MSFTIQGDGVETSKSYPKVYGDSLYVSLLLTKMESVSFYLRDDIYGLCLTRCLNFTLILV